MNSDTNAPHSVSEDMTQTFKDTRLSFDIGVQRQNSNEIQFALIHTCLEFSQRGGRVNGGRPELITRSVISALSPHSFFLILPFFWPPRPNPDFFTSPSHFLFLALSCFIPPLCRNRCFCCFLRCLRIWSLDFSSDRTFWPPAVPCACPRRPRPRPFNLQRDTV